jgi:competence protein ComEA
VYNPSLREKPEDTAFLKGDLMNWRTFFLGLFIGLISSALILAGNGRLEKYPIQLTSPADAPGVRVSMQGAVATPGVYRLAPGSIVEDALRAAGGLLPQADSSRLNPAAALVDGQEIRVPVRTPTPSAASQATDTSSTNAGRINLNTASLAELDSLPGIGPVIAQRILDYREETGPFQSVDGLLRVKGIGSSLLEKVRELVEAP